MTHKEQSERARVSTPCTAAHITFGGRCLNCGYEPTPEPVKPVLDPYIGSLEEELYNEDR